MSAERPNFRLGIVLLAYHRPRQLAELVRALSHARVTVYLHIDSAADLGPFRRALAQSGTPELVWLRRYRSAWGSLAIVDAELEGIRRALSDGCSYVAVISGEDFPLRPVEEIVEFLHANQARSFLETASLPCADWPYEGRARTDFYSYRLFGKHYSCVPMGEHTAEMPAARRLLNWGLRARFMFAPQRQFPDYLRPYGGQQWLNISAAAARQIIDFTDRHPDYRSYHIHTACPDEIFIQSILLGTDFARRHEVVNDDLRFLIWTGGDHPKTLGLADLPAMLDSADLFARKVVAEVDPELLEALLERSGVHPSSKTIAS